jgi:predicted PurR-regulated permease PerM
MNKTILPKAFLAFLIIAIVYACYLVFRPFLVEIIAAMILVSIFYAPYDWLARKLRGRTHLASLIMCLLILLVIIVPLANLVIYGAEKSVNAYTQTVSYFSQEEVNTAVKNKILEKANWLGMDREGVKSLVIDTVKKSNDLIVGGATDFVKGTANVLASLLLIFLTMFFFFTDGKAMLEKAMYWTPLSNKYDREIFKKFRDVSLYSMISTFLSGAAQGIVGAIGFLIVGLPAFFAGIFIALFSLVPYVGAGLVWASAGVYLLIIGEIWQGVFILIWGALFVSNVDNLVRAYVIKGKAEVHPIFVIFSVLGGISLFGFWGIFIGPLIISIAITILHIYELEYEEVLEK